jgi:hypothetical protein
MGVNKIRLNSAITIEQLVKEIINHPERRIIIEAVADATVLKNEVNLRLLKFYAEEEDKELMIKASDPGLLSLAQRLGISTLKEVELDLGDHNYDSLDEGENEVAATPEYEKPVKEGASRWPGQWITAVLVLIFTLGLALWFFIQPKAVVTVFPKFLDLEFTANAKISNYFKDEDILKGGIPARILTKEAGITIQTITTGKKLIGVAPAVGKAFFTNGTNQPVVLPKGTALIGRDGVRFLTDQDILVPQKSITFEAGIESAMVYGKAEVGITAEKKGTAGNQPARSITRIEGKYQRFLKVTNPAPTMNGTDKKVAVVTLEDIKKGEAEARQQMQLVGPDAVAALIGEEYLYLPDVTKLEVTKISYSQNIGGECDVLQTNLDYRISVLTPMRTGINKFLARQLDLNLPPSFQAMGHKVDLVSTTVTRTGDQWADLRIEGKGRIRGVLNPQKIKALIKGKSLEDAKTVLLGRNEIAGAKIVVSGSGTKLPGYGFQIRVLLPDGAGPR